MIRLLFVPVCALTVFSCNDTPKEIDPLFYQISEADSTRCMEEILDGILNDAIGKQKIEESLYNPNVAYCGVIDVLRITVNSRGDLMIDGDINDDRVYERVYQYFMYNRHLTLEERSKAVMNPDYPGFDFPFYNRFEKGELEEKIVRQTEELEEMRNIKGIDSLLIDYFQSKLREWQRRKRTLELIREENLPEVSLSAHVNFGFQGESDQMRIVLKEIALGFYHMRNYECLRYFSETYLSLYERSHRTNLKLDKEKLLALQSLHPAPIYLNDSTKPNPFEVMPPLPDPIP